MFFHLEDKLRQLLEIETNECLFFFFLRERERERILVGFVNIFINLFSSSQSTEGVGESTHQYYPKELNRSHFLCSHP